MKYSILIRTGVVCPGRAPHGARGLKLGKEAGYAKIPKVAPRMGRVD